jgi:BirA family biotin operon repressor/biotin-[acetyl-CoA-carboxylase] ligase
MCAGPMSTDVAAPLVPARVAAALTTTWLGRDYEWHASCASTSDLAAARARAGSPAGLVVAADAQTAGRGRLGRSWHSPAGESLYLSILLRPARPASEIPPLTLVAGAAVSDALVPLGVTPRLKWPNDVQLVGTDGVRRKLCGILTEMATAGARVEHVVVGIGVNVNGLDFPPELGGRATSLRAALGRPVDRTALLAALLAAFERRYAAYDVTGPAAAAAAFEAYAALPDRCRVNAGGAPLEGVALGVDPDGALRLRDDAGHIHRVISGELLP